MTFLLACSALALLAWLACWRRTQPHRVRERLEADPAAPDDLGGVTVIIPARDEAAADRPHDRGASALKAAGSTSSSSTISRATTRAGPPRARRERSFRCASSKGSRCPTAGPASSGRSSRASAVVDRPYVLLLDADIELAPGVVPALLAEARERDATLVSLLAELHCETFWERLLSPAFVFFFKLLYPFAWSNDATKATAAAAGGCMLVRTDALRQIGGFAAIRGALIDDCTLAAALKRHRPPIWLGMTPFRAQPARLRVARRLLEHGRPQRVHAASLLRRRGCSLRRR